MKTKSISARSVHRAKPLIATASETSTIVRPVVPPLVAPPSQAETRTVRVGYFRPEATKVFIVGSFNAWDPAATPLQRDELGDWSVELNLPRGEYRYRLMVDGEWADDPAATQTIPNPFGGFDAVLVV